MIGDTSIFEYNPDGLYKIEMKTLPEQCMLCLDKAKSNLFWLVEPKIDVLGIDAAIGSPSAKAINHRMTRDIRRMLGKMPIQFLKEWEAMDELYLDIAWEFPKNYREVMRERANRAQLRYLGREDTGNVVKINFRRSA